MMAYDENNHMESGLEGRPKDVLKRVKAAEKQRKDGKYDETWSKMIRVYSSQYNYDELGQYEDVIAPNMVFSTVNVIVPSVAINYPKITVTARREEDEQNAATVEAVANYYWQHFDTHEEFRAAVKDFVIIGHGWLKTTWAFSEEEVELEPDEWKSQVAQAIFQRNQAQEAAKAQGLDADFPSDREIIQSIGTSKTVVSEDHPATERVSPFDIFVDPSATRLKDARWIAQRAWVPIEVARSNDAWSASARKKLVARGMNRESVDVQPEGQELPKDDEFAIVWEFYDLITHKMCVFSEGCSDWLVEPEDVEYANGHPFVMLSNYAVPERFFPLGDVETILPLQLELAATRTQLIADRKRYRRMYLVRSEAIGPKGMDALLSGDDNVLLDIEGNMPFGDIMAPVGTTMLPPELYNQSGMILEDINYTTGINEYQRGGQSEIRRTATEAGMIADAANARSADKLATIERSIGEVAERVVALAQGNLTQAQVAKIVDDQGAIQWRPYSAEDIEGQFDFVVEAGSTQPQNESFRRQSAMQMMDAMAPFVSMGVVNPIQLATHVLKNGFGIKNPELFLQAPPPPTPPEGPPNGDPNTGGMPGDMPGSMPPM